MEEGENLRGRTVLVKVDGKVCRVEVITHLRADLWMVEGRTLPVRYQRFDNGRRMTVTRAAMTIVEDR